MQISSLKLIHIIIIWLLKYFYKRSQKIFTFKNQIFNYFVLKTTSKDNIQFFLYLSFFYKDNSYSNDYEQIIYQLS